MSTIPEICLQYTHVFQTQRVEIGIALVVGLIVGILAKKWDDR